MSRLDEFYCSINEMLAPYCWKRELEAESKAGSYFVHADRSEFADVGTRGRFNTSTPPFSTEIGICARRDTSMAPAAAHPRARDLVPQKVHFFVSFFISSSGLPSVRSFLFSFPLSSVFFRSHSEFLKTCLASPSLPMQRCSSQTLPRSSRKFFTAAAHALRTCFGLRRSSCNISTAPPRAHIAPWHQASFHHTPHLHSPATRTPPTFLTYRANLLT